MKPKATSPDAVSAIPLRKSARGLLALLLISVMAQSVEAYFRVIPDKADHLGVYLAAFSYLDEVGEGVTFYRYLDGFLHEKVMLIDEEGSAETIALAGDVETTARSWARTVVDMRRRVADAIRWTFIP